MQTQANQTQRDALSVITNPSRFADRPALRRLAWAALKAARGQGVHQHRLIALAASDAERGAV